MCYTICTQKQKEKTAEGVAKIYHNVALTNFALTGMSNYDQLFKDFNQIEDMINEQAKKKLDSGDEAGYLNIKADGNVLQYNQCTAYFQTKQVKCRNNTFFP